MSAALTTPRTPSRRLARAQSDLMLPSSSSPAGPSSSRAVMPSTPTRQSRPSLSASGRKRSRLDAGLEVDETDSLPATPLSRLRLQTPSTNTGTKPCNLFQTSPSSSALTLDEDMDSYFAAHSSQVSTQSSLFDTLSVADTASTPISSCCSSDREDSPSTTLEKLPAPVMERYSSIYAHARALLRYAAGVDPAETESGLTITGTGTSELHVKVVGRESERLAIQLFLQQRLGIFPHAPVQASDKGIELDGDVDSACLYVCGLPGTGKTALVRSVLNSLPAATSSSSPVPPRVAFVNCMTLSNPRLVFGKVLRALGSNAADGQPDSVAESALASLIRDGRQRILIVLDEMDHLLHSRAHQNILYRLFSWASSSASGATGGPTCSLIGIANSLDLTERFVPLLASKGASPALLHFRPFEATEIVTVIKDRLSGLRECYDDATRLDTVASSNDVAAEPLPLFTPTAVELLAKRIAGATGDLRKALDAARLAVEMVESEQRRAALAKLAAQEAREASEAKLAEAADEKAEAEPVSSQPAGDDVAAAAATARSNLLSHLTRATAPRATPSHVLKILSSVLGSPNLSKIRNLGVQPKLVLLAILVALARAEQGLAVLGTSGAKFSSSGVTEAGGLRIFDVESTYKALLKQDGEFSPLEGGELLGVFDVLEVNGVVRLSSEVDSVSSSSSSSSRNSVATLSNGVSPSGKRAAKKQLLASSRIVYLAMSHEDIQKGISTAAPCTVGSAASASTGPTTGKVVAETIARIYTREKDRAVKAQTYNSIIQENTRIRMEELGGGRMAIASGDL
ncbi:P-loop containing nucleoside triphosphate hydrolase protein [Testicularia cyperi]|uniref:P-loop containing nucleoside triphosphate hydrolase protein n=1 Tax=Testicularia cyperi TaxID=1882483 RepID=A0A317XK97_9BASI|nr:P-loop containing nucleoside triphosphate hydrolase protein [Testicularia cyperi]